MYKIVIPVYDYLQVLYKTQEVQKKFEISYIESTLRFAWYPLVFVCMDRSCYSLHGQA